jgi:hypothetical protein
VHNAPLFQSLSLFKRYLLKPREVVHTCDPSAGEAEAGGSRVPAQAGLHSGQNCQECSCANG